MAAGMEISESGKSAGVAFELPASYSSPAAKIPRRIRQRLLEVKNPLSLEEIENKLKEAELRRQRFHEWLANKARRPKPRSPSWSSQDSDLGQRLQERHYAAEQKRLSMLVKAQMKLARLDELRKAARTEVEIRYEKEREALGSKVESRVQQAELNRMLILKARCHRRALARERISKSLLKRMNQEKKYKECISNSISRKRAAAEKKRLGFLEAEKMRAHLRVLQARRVAKTIYHRREVDRKRMKDKMEDRLQRAKRQRAEYLRQRGAYRFSNINGNNMHVKGEFLSRKLARCWKEFLGSRRTTFALAKAYEALQITEEYVKLMPFEQLAVHIESVATIQTVKALLERLESRFKFLQTSSSSLVNIDHLLKRLASPKKPMAKANRGREAKRVLNKDIRSLDSNRLRYPTRVVLCAYMVLSHPDAVFSGNGEREVALVESALNFTRHFELLIKIILEGPSGNTTGPSQQLSPDVTTTGPSQQLSPDVTTANWSPNESSQSRLPTRQTFRSQLEAFDAAWCSYLYCFVVWKIKDARSLEDDLVRAACQLELSMMEKCKITAEGESNDLTHDMKAIQTQVSEDQKLLREKVLHLSGNPGIERMESALLEARLKFFEEKEKGTSSVTPLAHILSSSPIYSVESFPKEKRRVGNDGHSSRVARSLFKEESSKLEVDLIAPGGSVHGQLGSASETLIIENIFLVNEIIHEGPQAFADNFGENNKHENEIKGIIKETMEKAFWDGIMNSLTEGEQPDYDRIVQLVKEVRDELCEIAPLSWKQEIIETIDLDILAQLLKSGTHDTGYLGRILEYALVTLRKLSAPAKISEMETAHKNLLNELSDIFQSDDKLKSSFFIAAIKGLRFVLEEIQLLKWEISKARIRIMESFLKGRAGFEYLRKAFADRYGCPVDAILSLPLTSQWLGSVKNSTEQEWYEHVDFLSALKVHGSSTKYAKFLPSTSIRTGASIQLASNLTMSVSHPINTITDDEHLECKGESGDVLLRLGLLKLACGIDGVTQETLPETLKLNFSRLRAVQSQFQKIIVVSTSMLVLRQILLCENSNTRPLDMENIISASVERLFDLFEHSSDVGIVEIIETINSVPSSEGVSESISNLEKLQARKDTMARMLVKSLRADNAIFLKVARAIYLAARGVVLGGTTASGRELAAKALRPVGAIVLADRVVKTAETLVRMAMVSGLVHKQWYAVLAENV